MDAVEILKVWVNAKNNQGFTVLHYASYKGNIEVIKMLIENKANVEEVNNRGLNMLHLAAQGDQPPSLVYFKEKFMMNITSLDEMGSTPLHWACYSSSERALEFILSWDVNTNQPDKEGLTPLHLAVSSGIIHNKIR